MVRFAMEQLWRPDDVTFYSIIHGHNDYEERHSTLEEFKLA